LDSKMFGKLLWACLVLCQLNAVPGKIVVGMSADYPPFEFKQGEQIVGFDADLAKEIGKELGVEVELKDMAYSMLFNALDQGEIDLILSTVTISEERSKSFDFSIPYYFDTLAILHKSDQPISAANLKGKAIACQLGTSVMQAWLKSKSDDVKVVIMDAMVQMAESLKAGHFDGALMDATQAKEFVKNSQNLAFTIVGDAAEGSAVVLKKGSPLLAKVNAAISKSKENGTLKALENKWVGGNAHSAKHNLFTDLWFIAKGLPTTLSYSLFAMCIGGMLGVFWAVSRQLNFGVWAIAGTISVIRGTPFLLQLSFVYFSAPALLGIKLSVLVAGSLTLGINSAAYIAEILRSGLQSLPKGQFEACQALGISRWRSWKDIILPQVFCNVFPSLINEVVALTKETALVSVLGEMDVMRRAQTLAAETYNYFEPMCLAGLIYYLLIKTIEFIGKKLEQRWHHA
jgi:arginine/lysine/histidine transporter system substrate-binding protein